MSVLYCDGLAKRFGNKAALDGISLKVEENGIVGLIGRNGAGKTTFLKVLAGYLKPSGGEAMVFDQKPFDNIKVLPHILYMDDERYNDTMAIRDIVDLAALSYPAFDKQKAIRLLDYFGIPLKYKLKKLSKGTRTLFSLVIAILARCPLTMLDEPTLGLDAAHRKEFTSLLLKDYADHPRTFIISSHLIAELEGMMDQVVLIDRGRLVFHKSIEEAQSHALYLTGHRRALDPLMTEHKVIFRDGMGEKLTLGVVNDFSDEALSSLAGAGVEISPMSVQDLCVNLTAAHTGGVLDVISD